ARSPRPPRAPRADATGCRRDPRRARASRSSRAPYRQAGGLPGAEAAFEIRRVHEAELLERRGGETRGVALGADDDDRLLVARDDAEPVIARGIEAPFEHVPLDDQRSGDLPFP